MKTHPMFSFRFYDNNFMFTMSFKLVASSLWKKVANLYKQSSRHVLSPVDAY